MRDKRRGMRGIEWVTINILNTVPVLNSTSTVGNMIFLQYVDFSLGLQENYIFQWTFAVNFKKLNIVKDCLLNPDHFICKYCRGLGSSHVPRITRKAS